VSLGLPVYNGEEFLQQALDAILKQTFRDFELIMADNASTDGTRGICEGYAGRDPRFRFFRNETNIGGAKNHNLVLNLSRGEYFKWTAHDDLMAPTYLERCVEVLDSDPTIILCHSRTVRFQETGRTSTDAVHPTRITSTRPQDRFREVLNGLHMSRGSANLINGLIRSDALRRAGGMGNYVGADRVAAAQLALSGRFFLVPEELFFRRIHPAKSTRRFLDARDRLAWWDPSKAGWISFPYWRLFLEFSRAVLRAPVNGRARLDGCLSIGMWLAGTKTRKGKWRDLVRDVKIAARRLLLARRAAASAQGRLPGAKSRLGVTLNEGGSKGPSP
jgi:glycosyltransferase involved in cell wall biosynthesis